MKKIDININNYTLVYKKVSVNLPGLIDEFKITHQTDKYNIIIHDSIFIKNINELININKNKFSYISNLFQEFIKVIADGIDSPNSSFINYKKQTTEIITLFFNKGVVPDMKLLYNITFNKSTAGFKERGLLIDLIVNVYNEAYNTIKYPLIFYSKKQNTDISYLISCSKFLQLPHTIETLTTIHKNIVSIIVEYL
jgi:hypothetical protein